MPLVDVELLLRPSVLPEEIRAFLCEADMRVSRYQENNAFRSNGFVPCDFVTVYHALRAIVDASLVSGNTFCEWGSGFGVVTGLAGMLDFDACGIEIDRDLVEAARELIEDFHLPVEIVAGSFVPPGDEMYAEEASADHFGASFFLETNADSAYEELGLGPDDFDLVFAYPWPGEEETINMLFERNAASGALLLTYGGIESIRLQRRLD